MFLKRASLLFVILQEFSEKVQHLSQTFNILNDINHFNQRLQIMDFISIKVAIEKKSLSHCDSQTLKQPLREVEVLYAGESRLGDDIEIYTWTNKQKPGCLFAHVKKDTTPIVHINFKLDTNTIVSKL